MKFPRLPLGTLAKLVEGWRSPKEYIPKYICAIDNLPMQKVGNVEGNSLYQCPNGHTRVPGLDVGDPGGLIEKTKGDFHGEI